MSDLYKALPQEEVDLFHTYLRYYSCGAPLPRDSMDYFLRYWSEEKTNLYRMFDNKFIIKREVKFEKPSGELQEEMNEILRNHPFIEDFYKFARDIFDIDIRFSLNDMVYDSADFVDNIYRGNTFVIPAEFTKSNKEIQVVKGCKIVKILGKIATAVGIDTYFEDFRQKHSQILNQKKVTGTLCLSIHPLDYITMSDNECGWSSCMSWMNDDPGDYRLGTIEMMNSPYVVVAYLEAADTMWVPDGYRWNNKKWRQLYVVSPEMILGNRQYPYENDELQGVALNWLKDMASKIPGYGPYMPEASSVINHEINSFGERKIRVVLNMNYMYNDIYGHRLAYFSSEYNNSSYYLNVSGAAVCTGCGEVIELDTVEACSVRCLECDGVWKCWYCGDIYSGDQYWVEDHPVCQWCYDHELAKCNNCEDVVTETYGIPLVLVAGEEDKQYEPLYEQFNGRYAYEVCECCYNHESEYENFGKVIEITLKYGSKWKAFDLMKVNEDALESLDVSQYVKDALWLLRNAETIEERITILKEKFYIDFS